MVGRVLADQARREGRDVLALTSAQWDITDATAAERFVESGDVVINCAGYTKVDAAEADGLARTLSTPSPRTSPTPARAGAELIHISTDYVFSGASAIPTRSTTKPVR